MIDTVFDITLLLREALLHFGEGGGGGNRELGLHARLEAHLRLGHELGAHLVPAGEVGRGDGDRRVSEIAYCACKQYGENGRRASGQEKRTIAHL